MAVRAVRHAADLSMRVLLDPGGPYLTSDLVDALASHLFLLKPNEHEARRLTGVEIMGLHEARAAARVLRRGGAQNVLITHGAHGAYLFTGRAEEHIAAPELPVRGQTDATGCGDQVMAGLCAGLHRGLDVRRAARIAVRAGTLQWHRPGVQPVTWNEATAL